MRGRKNMGRGVKRGWKNMGRGVKTGRGAKAPRRNRWASAAEAANSSSPSEAAPRAGNVERTRMVLFSVRAKAKADSWFRSGQEAGPGRAGRRTFGGLSVQGCKHDAGG